MSAILFPRAWTTPIFSTLMQKTLLPIQAVARKLEIPEEYFEPWGSQTEKSSWSCSRSLIQAPRKIDHCHRDHAHGAGRRKTVTSISLTQASRTSARKSSLPRASLRSPCLWNERRATAASFANRAQRRKSIFIFTAIFTPSPRPTICSPLSSMPISSTATTCIWIRAHHLARTMDMNDRALRRIAVSLDSKKDSRRPYRFRHHRRFGNHGHRRTAKAGRSAQTPGFHRHRRHSRRKTVSARDLGATGGMMVCSQKLFFPISSKPPTARPPSSRRPFGNIAHARAASFPANGLRLATMS